MASSSRRPGLCYYRSALPGNRPEATAADHGTYCAIIGVVNDAVILERHRQFTCLDAEYIADRQLLQHSHLHNLDQKNIRRKSNCKLNVKFFFVFLYTILFNTIDYGE